MSRDSEAATGQNDRRVSIRLRLTLWNIGVVVLILFGMGVVLRFALQATLISSVDHDLAHSIRGIDDFVAHTGHIPLPPPDSSPNNKELGPQIFDASGQNTPKTALRIAPYDPAGFHTALTTGVSAYATVIIRNQPFRILSYPMHQGTGTVQWVVQMPRPLGEIDREIDRLTRLLFLLAGPGVLLGGLGGAFLTTRALRPVRQITHAAARIEAEDLSRRLTVTGKDELSELSTTFNAMLARLQEAFEQRANAYDRMERAFEQQKRFTADASHELKSPLTVIEGTVSLNLGGGERTFAQYQRALETVGRSAGTMTRIVQDLLLLARSDAGHLDLELRPVSLYQVATLARDAIGENTGTRAPVLMPDADPEVFVRADPAHLSRLIVNLLENALRHTPSEGRIVLRVSAEGGDAVVRVTDTGCGIPASDLPHIFDRFYRVDAARARAHGGTGLGLAIGRSIAEAHGGTLNVASELGVGTTVSLRLPRFDERDLSAERLEPKPE